jgi:pSer/pThr/pTyr-binding forkhead associated (FHA) protein
MNGTTANGRPVVGPTVLHDGDLVQVGDTVMRVTRQ